MDWDFHNSLNELIDEGLKNGTAGWGTTRTGYSDPPRRLPWQNPKDFSDAVDRVQRLQDPCSFMDNCYACEATRTVKMRADCGGIRLCQKCYDEEKLEDALLESMREAPQWGGDTVLDSRGRSGPMGRKDVRTPHQIRMDKKYPPGSAERAHYLNQLRSNPCSCSMCKQMDGNGKKKPPPDNSWIESEIIGGIDWGWFGRFGRGLAYGWILEVAEGTIPWAGKLYHLIRKSVDRNYREEYQ